MDIKSIYELLSMYEKGKITVEAISENLNKSERQVYRIISRYKTEGILGLQHKGKHKISNHKISESKKQEKLWHLSTLGLFLYV